MHSGQVDMTRAWTGMAPLARCRHAGIRVTAGEKALIPLYMYFSDFLTCISLILKTIFLWFEKLYFAYYDLCRYGTSGQLPARTAVSELPQEREEGSPSPLRLPPQSAGARRTVHTSIHRRRRRPVDSKIWKPTECRVEFCDFFPKAKVRSDPKTGFPISGHVMEAPC